MKFQLTLFALFFGFFSLSSQKNFDVYVSGLKAGDSAQVTIQKSSSSLFKKWAKSTDGSDVNLNFSLNDGKWALSIDATGYTYPTAKIINIPSDSNATITLTEMISNGVFKYSWNDDDSAAGHNTQSYYSEPTSIKVLDKTVNVPNDYSSIYLRNRYGIILSNEIEPWSIEDSYRLFKTMEMLPYDPYDGVDFSSGDNIRGIFKLTKDDQYRDISITQEGSLKNVTISQRAFVYASPQIVTIDGIKGKFYSKRLYHSIINYLTDFGNDADEVNKIANASFGVKFMESNQETEDLMGEDSSNFQSFTPEEKIEILGMFEELPEGFHKQEGLKYLVRRINGQDNPKYKTAAAIAWTGGSSDYLENYTTPTDGSKANTIEFMSKAFNGGSLNDSRRLILHEKAHFLWEYSFDDNLKEDWAEIGGWFEDPTSASGWSTYNTTESVSAYAHLKNPNEDMAESIAFYLTNPDKLLNVSVKKYEFIRDRVMHGTRYVAQIREDLTFTVYNLFPDYTFPGKVTGLDIEVTGEPTADKQVTLKVKLNSENFPLDGASEVYTRFVSSIGTIHDIRLNPQNGESVDSILVGTSKWNKYEKAGYWTLQYMKIYDQVRNARYENTSTVGMKLFINNVHEDILPPVWNYDLKLEEVDGKFTNSLNETQPDENGIDMKAIKISSSIYDNRRMNRILTRIINPTIDSATGEKLESGDFIYERQNQAYPLVDSERGYDNDYDSDKHFESYLAVPSYFPSGYYSVSMLNMKDYAGNGADVFFVKDTSDFYISPADKLINYKDVRDSIYVKTEYPDYRRPEIDINNITIVAEPTKPEAPDGETRVDITLIARDISDFVGKEAGVSAVSFVLRDPLGNDHGYQTGNSTMNHPALDKTRGNPNYDGSSEWKAFDFNLTLPQGSPPGKWGLLEAMVRDKAGNMRKYSFVEYVRFDVIESDVVLTTPLEVEILEKHINAKNVDSITAKMLCSPCKDLNYVYTIYSRIGGGGAVVRGEGVFESDTIVVNNIKTSGVLDGLVNLTVQVTDTTSALVATKTAEYLKDVVYPKAYYSKSNIQDQGWSNIDNIVISIEVESQDVNGTYNVNVSNNDNNNSGIPQGASSSFSSLDFKGDISKSKFNFNASDISNLTDGYLKFTTTITDQVGNVGDPVVSYYLKDGTRIQYVGNEIDPDSDEDSDSVIFSEDNSPTYFNPLQEDIDNDGIGDWSDNSTIMTSISEKFMSDTINLKSLIEKSLMKIHGEERELKTLDFRNINDNSNNFTVNKSSFKVYKNENHSVDFLDQYIYDFKLGVKNINDQQAESIDSLDLRVYIDRHKKPEKVDSEINKVNGNLSQYKYFSPYRIGPDDSEHWDKHYDISTQWRGPDFESSAYFEDINNDGNMDLIIGDYRVDYYGINFSIHHLSDFVYLLGDGNFNFTSTFNSEINGVENNAINHAPNITIRADLNNDGKKEIVNYGEEYHITFPPHHPHVNYIHEWMYSKDLVFEKDFNDAGKKTRYYSFHESGQLIDEVDRISFPDISNTNNPNYLRSMFASTVGDLDNDGDLDLISSGQNYKMGYSYDILKNDGQGNFVLESQFLTDNYSSLDYVTSEGHMLVFDVDSDGNNDLLFGAGKRNNQNNNYDSYLGLIKGDGNTLDFENPIFLDLSPSHLSLRSVFYEDVNGDDIKEVIVYYTVGFGCNGCGLTDDDIPNIIKIYELVDSSEGYLKDVSEQYFSDNQNFMDFYSQTSFLQYLDLDGDGHKDIVPKFSLEDPEFENYPGNAYRGDWNDSKGFQYFKFDKESEKFILRDLGLFNNIKHYNNFDFADLNNDGNLEWITFIESSGPDNGFYIFEFFFKPRTQDIQSSVDEDKVVDVTLKGSDLEGNDLIYSIVDEPSNGTVSIDGDKVTYTPSKNYNGEDAFTYKVNDGTDDSNTSTVTITVNPVNDAPTVADLSLSTKLNTDGSTEFDGSDIDGDTLTYFVATEPENGSVSIENDTFIYTPENNYIGKDTFTYKANDGSVDSNEATVTVDIEDVDSDSDGVSDRFDQCPDTPGGALVNTEGCEIFTLPINNFSVEVRSATCIGNSDGSINLSVEDSTVDYTVTITGKDNVTITGDTKTASVSGLAKGAYTVCFKVDGQSSYEQCFDVVVGEPDKLNAFVSVDEDEKKVSIAMSGSDTYNIEINGKKMSVSSDSFDTELNTGLNIIKVYTDLECQGSIEQEVFISEDIHYYPNPTNNDVKVHVGGKDQKVKVSVFNTAGALIYTQEQTIEDVTRKTEIDLSKQKTGTYVVVMESETVRKTFKIIRE